MLFSPGLAGVWRTATGPQVLLVARARDDLADLLHVLSKAGNGIAAGDSDCDECESNDFFHGYSCFVVLDVAGMIDAGHSLWALAPAR
jgi:hypothetical protein